MDLFLKIAGGVLVGVVVGVVVLLLVARLFLKRIAGQVTQGLEQFAGGVVGLPPSQINLDQSEEGVEWDDEAAIAAMSRELVSLGFEAIGDFEVLEMTGVCIRGFVNPEQAVLAAITEHATAGVFVDIVQQFQAESGDVEAAISVTSAPETGLAAPPWKTEVRVPGADVSQLWSMFCERRPDRTPMPVAAHVFQARFEESYAREMTWMIERGGPSQEEILAVANLGGEGASDEEVEIVRRVWDARIQEEIDTKVRDQFLATTDMRAGAWDRVCDRVVVVHDHLDGETLDELISDALDWEDDDACKAACVRATELRGAGAGRAAFVRMQEALPPSRRHKKIGGVGEPIPADVYVAPDDLDSLTERRSLPPSRPRSAAERSSHVQRV